VYHFLLLFFFKVIGNRLAQVHFYRKDDAHQSSAETMETLVHKTSGAERNLGSAATATSHAHYSSTSNTNAPLPTLQVALSQPAQLATAAKPVRDSAQFVSEN
jgi:hypothetical protein